MTVCLCQEPGTADVTFRFRATLPHPNTVSATSAAEDEKNGAEFITTSVSLPFIGWFTD